MPPRSNDNVSGAHALDHERARASNPIHHPRPLRIICIGAGIAGLCFAYKLQRSFEEYELVVYEKNAGMGGVWFENRYPG